MPDRHQSFDALILRSKESPSGDRIVSMLGAEQGIVDVFVFGGAKSSLRATASPFVHARVFVYEDPVKKFRKLSDLTILESFSGLRETYTRLWCASVVAELIIRTSGCGGDYPYVMDLSLEALRLLDSAGDSVSRSTLLAYLWKILGVMGVQPDLDRCSYCGKEIPEGFHDLRFSAAHEGFICGSCGEDANRLTSGELALLEAFTYSSLAECAGIDVGESALSSLKEIIYFLTQKAAEGTLLTLMSE